MKIWNTFSFACAAFCVMAAAINVFAASDPNFHIYIAYGQSNMAGAGDIRNGTDNVEHPRYKMFATNTCDESTYPVWYSGNKVLRPTLYEMYPAIPPMFHCTEGLSVADWFGRALADSLPGVTVAVIPVAVGGTKIELFDKDQYAAYLSNDPSKNENDVPAQYLVDFAKDYGSDGNAHARIVATAKKAMEKGVVKGFIFHQGESGAMEGNDWVSEVKKTRDDILTALNLSADTVPFLAGEMLRTGCCYKWSQVSQLPQKMVNTYIVSSENLTGNGTDNFHFSSESYKEFGVRYANMMLAHGNKLKAVATTQSSASTSSSASTVFVSSSSAAKPRQPYDGKVANVPGKVEAENFDEPGEGETNQTYSDTQAGNQVCTYDGEDVCSSFRENTDVDLKKQGDGVVIGVFATGEWLEYTVNAEKEGTYTLYVAGASQSGGTLQFTVKDASGKEISKTGDITVVAASSEEGAFDEYAKTAGANVKLAKGVNIIRMTCTKEYLDVDYFNLVYGENAADNILIGQEVEPEYTPAEEILSSASGEVKSSDSKDGKDAIFADRLNMRSDSVESYDVFDMQGNFMGRLGAYSMGEALSKLPTTRMVKSNGMYLIRNEKGFSKAVRIIRK